MSKSCVLGVLVMLVMPVMPLGVSGCVGTADPADPLSDVAQETQVPGESPDSPSHGETCKADGSFNLVGTWTVTNHGHGATGKVTFKSDGSYTIDSGTYNAGGTWNRSTSGTYGTLPGGAIGFKYTGWTFPSAFSRIAVVRCASANQIVHYTLGHSHDYESLSRVRP
jgi:hypothetical protein